MTAAFLPIIIIVAVIGLGVSVTRLAWPFSVMDRIGRTGSWIHHADMDPLGDQPDGNENDAAIEHRPLRARA